LFGPTGLASALRRFPKLVHPRLLGQPLLFGRAVVEEVFKSWVPGLGSFLGPSPSDVQWRVRVRCARCFLEWIFLSERRLGSEVCVSFRVVGLLLGRARGSVSGAAFGSQKWVRCWVLSLVFDLAVPKTGPHLVPAFGVTFLGSCALFPAVPALWSLQLWWLAGAWLLAWPRAQGPRNCQSPPDAVRIWAGFRPRIRGHTRVRFVFWAGSGPGKWYR